MARSDAIRQFLAKGHGSACRFLALAPGFGTERFFQAELGGGKRIEMRLQGLEIHRGFAAKQQDQKCDAHKRSAKNCEKIKCGHAVNSAMSLACPSRVPRD
jgi:hypothetical protein